MAASERPQRFKRPRITLFQILMLFAIFASLLAGIQIEEGNDHLIWSHSPLTYHVPDVPVHFQKAGKCDMIPGSGMLEMPTFSNVSALYLYYHFLGWEWERDKFFDHETDQGARWTRPDEEIDPHHHWGTQVGDFAIQSGAFQCQEQISELLSTYSEVELRQKIAYSKNWLRIPIVVIGALALGGLLWKPLADPFNSLPSTATLISLFPMAELNCLIGRRMLANLR